MGVHKRLTNSVAKGMNSSLLQSGPVAGETMLPDACVGSLNNNETLEELKERLRKGVCHASYGCPLPVLGEKPALMNDLSQSLPNLVGSDPHLKHLSEGTPARNSCSDIFTKNNGISNGKVISGVCVKPGIETTLEGETPQRRNTLTVSLSPDNNRLSAVLQNIPLLYIPETKQLISVGPTADNVDNRTSQVGNKTEATDAAIQGLITADDINNDLDQSRERHSSKADSEISSCSVTSSQPTSDTSTVSDKTVTHVCNYDAAQSVIDGPSDTTLEDVSFSEDPCAVSDRAEVPLITHPDPAGSLGKTDASSFSSISSISTGTEFSISAASYSDDVSEFRVGAVVGDTDDSGFTEVNLQGGNTYERSRNSSQDSGFEEKQNAAAKTKRRGLTSFLARNLFSRKPKEAGPSQASALGWKLFGRIPPKETPVVKEASVISEEYQAKLRTTLLQQPTKKADIEVSSTTALILENRPQGLPSKTPEEERKHRQEYEAMVEAAKRREVREAKLRKKQMRRQIQHEELLAASLQVWTKEILPNWEHMRHSKRTKELWWQGLPPSVRGRVWKLAIGNDLNLTDELYEICVSRAEDRLKLISEDSDSESSNEPESSKEASVELIKLDISRTFPQLCIFQKGGPYHDILHSLLGAYVCYRPDVGYVQGMSFIAAVFLLNMEAADAFRCFANLLNQPCQIAFFRLDESLMKSYFATYEEFLEENLPKLYSHFQKQSLTPDLYLIDWMFTLYSKSLPLDVASRVWDVFSRDGEEFLFRTALGILKLYEEDLLNLDFIHLAQFLTRLPESLPGDKLFRCIDRIHLLTYNRTFSQVLAGHKENKDVS